VRRLLVVLVAAAALSQAFGDGVEKLPPKVVAATAGETDPFDVPASVSTIKFDDLLEMPEPLFPATLGNLPGVSPQRTCFGYCSPFIRGFTGYRTLLVIDDVRVNTSIVRSGPNEYWNLFDRWLFERVEVLRGPASVLYGSDALGGVAYCRTYDPWRWGSGTRVVLRGASAAQETLVHLRRNGKTERVAYTLAASYLDTNDVVTGRHVGLIHYTGYHAAYGDARFVWALSERAKIVTALIHGTHADVPRTHKTIYMKTYWGTTHGSYRVYEYNNYLTLGYVQLRATPKKLVDNLLLSLSYQLHKKNKVQQKDGSTETKVTGFEVGTVGLLARARKNLKGVGQFTFGAEVYSDDVDSYKWKIDSSTGMRTDYVRGDVADDSTYTLSSLFAQQQFSLVGVDWVVGLRYSMVKLKAGVVDPDPTDAFDYPGFSHTYDALVGNVRGVWKAAEDHRIIFGVSQGFRAPNLDDTTTFKDVASNSHDVPAPDVEPEYCTMVELGWRTRMRERLLFEAFYYRNFLRDFIARVPTTYAGSPTDADGRQYYAKQNFANGYMQGVELMARYLVGNRIQALAPYKVRLELGFSWTEGYGDALVGGKKVTRPLRRTPPAQVRTRIRFALSRATDAFVEHLYTFKQTHLSPGDEKDTDRIPPGGTPGYYLLNFGLAWRAAEGVRLNLLVQNITDNDWRVHGSGINGVGTNFVATLLYEF